MALAEDGKSFQRTPTSWDAQDDILLMHLKDTQKLGWKEIALHFQNRTPNACQFRWRRLKSGNLKNPPKSAQALGGLAAAAVAVTKEKKPEPEIPVYAPLAQLTFQGYDTPAMAAGPALALFALPKEEVSLDPQAHAPGTTGGYFTDISIDPTSNLPHNQPHRVPSPGMTPRTSNAGQPVRNGLIVAFSERNLVLRLLVSSLPSKLMNIPHHQLTNLALAHVPYFGSVSGALGMGSTLGPLGAQALHAANLLSVRSGLVVGLRSGLVLGLRSEVRRGLLSRELPGAEEKRDKPVFRIPWLMEEDELLVNRRRKELSFAELLILLPQRTEGEIWARIDALERLRNGHRALRRRQSSVGLDDVDDFLNDVDLVIPDMDLDDEHVLLDAEDSLPAHLRRSRKRRASLAVNPLSVREGIKRRLH